MRASDDPAVSGMFDELHAAGVETAGFGVYSKSAEWFDQGAAAPILLRWLQRCYFEKPSVCRSTSARFRKAGN
jgi:hypothetical protein